MTKAPPLRIVVALQPNGRPAVPLLVLGMAHEAYCNEGIRQRQAKEKRSEEKMLTKAIKAAVLAYAKFDGSKPGETR
jgi:hypothetical protein